MAIDIRGQLLSMQDIEYKNFHCRLMPTVDPDKVIGVRIPQLRKFANEISGTKAAEEFVSAMPHEFYEENNLHGFLVEKIKDYEKCIAEINKFLPYVDNWATCDLISPKVFKKKRLELLGQIDKWLRDKHTYTVRFGIGMLMKFYLDENFEDKYLKMVAAVKSDEYYVNMMISWYFATALAKQYDATLPYIENNVLDAWVHNKTIQKSVESYRITTEQKEYLKRLKRK